MSLLNKLRGLLFKGHDRTVKARKNVLITILIKALGVGIGFIYFPLSLDYLGAVKFGIYLTMISMVDWFLNFDVGIGLGLRNKFGEAVARDDEEDAITYVSTAYFSLGIIVIVVTAILAVLNYVLPWPSWIQVTSDLEAEVRALGLIIILAFGIRFIAGIVYEIFYALQRMAYVEFFLFLSKAIFLILILLLPFIQADSLLLFGSAKSLTFALVPLFVGFYFFATQFAKYRPSLKTVRWDYFKGLFTLSLKFFIIKISMLVIHQTNNFLIALFVSLQGVSQYEAAYKFLSIFMMLFVILNNQLWPSNLEAYVKGEFEWMRKSMQVVSRIWLGTVVLASLMVLVSPWFYSIWLQDNLDVPMKISIAVACSICLTTWVNMHNLVLNGTGKIKLQMYAWIFAALINIPASIWLAKYLELGVVGIVLGTFVSMIPLGILSPIQVRRILAQKDSGIWAQ